MHFDSKFYFEYRNKTRTEIQQHLKSSKISPSGVIYYMYNMQMEISFLTHISHVLQNRFLWDLHCQPGNFRGVV